MTKVEVNMKEVGKKYRKNLAALVIVLALSGLVILCYMTGILDEVEFRVYDFRINVLADKRPRSADIYMIMVDDESVEWAQRERGWGWPWPRQAYAEFLDYMRLGNARAVAFDILFSEPSIYRNARQDQIIENSLRNLAAAQGNMAQSREAGTMLAEVERGIRSLNEKEDDASFATATKNLGRVVQGVQLGVRSGRADTWPVNLNVPLFKTNNFDSIISQFGFSDEGILNSAQLPIEELRNAAGAIGAFTGIPDSDNIIRRHRLFSLFDGKAVPGLGPAALLVSGHDENLSYDAKKKIIRWGDFSIPVDNEGKTLLRYRGDPLKEYLNKSMHAVLQSAEDFASGREPLLPPDVFDDCFVFVGLYGQGLFDIFHTPIASVYPGMGVHVTLLDNLLMGDFITKAPNGIAVLLIVASVVLVVFLVLYTGRAAVSVAGLVGALAVLIIAGFWAFYAGWWIPMVAPIAALILAFLTATLYSYATEGKDKRFIKNAFSRILSPKVIDQIIADPSQLKLGGERRKMTAIFTDIQRFSSISSELQDQYGEDGPKVLVNLLNLYFTEMSNIVLENGGTIDKYEGDAIIAFFGAPVWMESHAAAACRSAIRMKRREFDLQAMVMNPDGEFYKPLSKLIEEKVIPLERPLFTRLGINTGDMVVGFMGTPAKMDYTIMGNAVNLSSRLEGVNKQYNTHGILISEYTREVIGDEFIIRPLSRVTVVGIPVPVRLYELLEIRAEASADMVEMVSSWERAFAAYENKDFTAAKKIFAGIYEKYADDRVAKLYLDRCNEYIAEPPPEDWDAVDNLTEK